MQYFVFSFLTEHLFQELTYLSAVLAIKRNKGPEKALELLNSAIETHFKSLKVGMILINAYSKQKMNNSFRLLCHLARLLHLLRQEHLVECL